VVDAGTVTFNVSWNKATMPVEMWSDSVWVFVDYNNADKMERLPLLPGATLTTTSAPDVGRTIQYSENDKGVWVVGNAKSVANSSGSFSATVKLLTAPATVVGACAYASNYPPMAEYLTAQTIKFTGTPPYDLVLNTGTATMRKQAYSEYNLLAGQTLETFSDKTGAPGFIKCMPPPVYDLIASGSAFCVGDPTGIVFALSNTEDGRKYQLYRGNDAVGDVLSGAGDGVATFTGGPFNTAGTYTAWTIAENGYCAIPMSRTHLVYENPLPDDPDVFGDTRNCAGTVTLSASSSGAVIDWYADAAATTTLHTGASYTTPEIGVRTTYYIQARNELTGCLSSARVPVLAEVITEGCCVAPGDSWATFATFEPCAGAPYGSTYTLTDDRDDKTYKVKLLPDDRYWMVQDLRFGEKCETKTSDRKSVV
jgi:hypothetical protein